jgi:hypothetical protein
VNRAADWLKQAERDLGLAETAIPPSEYFSEEGTRELVEHARAILKFCRSQIS